MHLKDTTCPRSPLTIRKRREGHVLGGDAGAVAVVGEEAQGVLGELLQPLQAVGEPVHLHVLAHRDDKGGGNVSAGASAAGPPDTGYSTASGKRLSSLREAKLPLRHSKPRARGTVRRVMKHQPRFHQEHPAAWRENRLFLPGFMFYPPT